MNIRTKIAIGAVGSLVALATVAMIPSAFAGTAPTVTTTIRDSNSNNLTSAPVGSSVMDVATVASSTASTTPTGTVQFNVFQNMSCSGATSTQTVSLVNGVATSSPVTVPASGLSFQVHYNGDNANVTGESVCEVLTPTTSGVTISTTLSTTSIQAGGFVNDDANLSGETGSAGGTVSYKVYSDNQCTNLALDAGSKAVTNGNVPSSDSWQFITPGTYWWQAHYSGDNNNNAATSTCGSEVLTVLATSTPTTTVGTITVDKVTNPSGDTTSFHFTTSGSGYGSFNLTDQATPNTQTLNPGNYTVSEDSTSGWTLTSAQCSVNGGTGGAYTPGSTISLAAGQAVTCVFTNTKNGTTTNPGTGSISGEKYNDLNRNGQKDSGEPGLQGWTIQLFGTSKQHGWSWSHGKKVGFWNNKNVTQTAVTDANGNYSFTNLSDGTYIVREVPQSGWKQDSTNPGPITIANGNSVTNVDFGNASTTVKSGHNGHGDNDGDDDDNDGDNGNGNGQGNGMGNHIQGFVHGILDNVFSHFGHGFPFNNGKNDDN